MLANTLPHKNKKIKFLKYPGTIYVFDLQCIRHCNKINVNHKMYKLTIQQSLCVQPSHPQTS